MLVPVLLLSLNPMPMLSSFTARLAAALGLLALLTTCSKKDPAPAPAPQPMGVSWTVNGTPVKTSTGRFSFRTSGGVSTASLSVSLSDLSALELVLPDPLVEGTYALAGGLNSTTLAVYVVPAVTPSWLRYYYRATSGSITITKVSNNTVSGTFAFSGSCTGNGICPGNAPLTIANGNFHVGR